MIVMKKTWQGLTFTVETRADFTDNWMSTLDCSMKLCNVIDNNITFCILKYKFYKKPTSSQLTILKTSASTQNCKDSSLTQEVVRRMLNTSEYCSQQCRNLIIDEYDSQLMMSGYSRADIRNYMVLGLKGYETKRSNAIEREQPIHRPGSLGRFNRKELTVQPAKDLKLKQSNVPPDLSI